MSTPDNSSTGFESYKPYANTNRYNLYSKMPNNKKVTISGGDVGNEGIMLFMDDDVSIKCSSKFGPLWEAQPNNLANLLSSSFGLPSGQFALQGAQIWQSTDPLTLSFNGTRYMDNNSYHDVVEPAKILTGLCLPSLSGSKDTVAFKMEQFVGKTVGLKLATLIPPGPNIQTLLNAFSDQSYAGTGTFLDWLKSKIDLGGNYRGLFTVNIGKFEFIGCVAKSVTPTFSKEVAYSTYSYKYIDSNGKQQTSTHSGYFPISVNIAMEFITIQVATTDYVNGIIS